MGEGAKKKINPHDLADSIRSGASDNILKMRFGLSPEQASKAKEKLVQMGLLEKSFLPQAWLCPHCGFAEPQKPVECPRCGLLPDKVKTVSNDAVIPKGEPIDTLRNQNRQSKSSQAKQGLIAGVAALSLIVIVLLVVGLMSRSKDLGKSVSFSKADQQAVDSVFKEAQSILNQIQTGLSLMEYRSARTAFTRATGPFKAQVGPKNPGAMLIVYAMEKHLTAAQDIWWGMINEKHSVYKDAMGNYRTAVPDYLEKLSQDPDIGHFCQDALDEAKRTNNEKMKEISENVRRKHWSEFSRLIGVLKETLENK